MVERKCEICGNLFQAHECQVRIHGYARFCSRPCFYRHRSVTAVHAPIRDSDGRVWIQMPGHPSATKQGRVRRARLVAEKMLGRALEAHEVVHHKDGNPANDDDGNLEVTTQSAHCKIHARDLALAAGYEPTTHKKCTRCCVIKPHRDFSTGSSRGVRHVQSKCKPCSAARAMELKKGTN